MPYIQLDETQFPLRVGETRLGGPGAEITLPGTTSSGPEAVVQCGGPDEVFIRRAREDAAVRVNGVLLGVEPTPLFHGDKIEIGARELLFGDDRRGGSTQFLAGAQVRERLGRGAQEPPEPQAPQPRGAARRPTRPTASTGGRLVSLVDGREYAVPGGGATIGRDAGCDIVVASNDVSRHHAELRPVEGGYLLRDQSTNGVCVNEVRIDGEQLLGRGDIVRIGSEEFRFYADEASDGGPAPGGDGAGRPVYAPAHVPSLADTMAQAAVVRSVGGQRPSAEAPTAAPPAAQRSASGKPLLATLEILNQGVLHGRRFEVRTPLAHVGRGAHNDVVIADDSVSETHAKLQKREAGWFVVDMNSTNGTYVGGKRISGEQALGGAADVRFGGVKMAFRPFGAAGAAAAVDDASGTRVITGRGPAARQPARPVTVPAAVPSGTAAAGPQGSASEEVSRSGGLPGWLWVVGLAAAGATAFLFLRQAR